MQAKSKIPQVETTDFLTDWLTTGQVARRLGVSARTVAQYIDSGRMLGMRLPMSKARRVAPEALREFCKREGFDRARGA
jgi:excisionase family DNA binding protein